MQSFFPLNPCPSLGRTILTHNVRTGEVLLKFYICLRSLMLTPHVDPPLLRKWISSVLFLLPNMLSETGIKVYSKVFCLATGWNKFAIKFYGYFWSNKLIQTKED